MQEESRWRRAHGRDHAQGERAESQGRRRRPEHAFTLRFARRSRAAWPEVRLRPRPVRRLLRPHRRSGGALLRDGPSHRDHPRAGRRAHDRQWPVAIRRRLAQLYQQSTTVRVGRAEALIGRACDLIRDRYSAYEAKWPGPAPALSDPKLRRDLATAVNQALTGQNDVEGGVWQADAGPLAYAFPTYPGTGPKSDLPAAERDHIQAVNEEAARDERPLSRRSVSREQNLLLYACPLSGPIPRLTDDDFGSRPSRITIGFASASAFCLHSWC